jgi:hypothetical protein
MRANFVSAACYVRAETCPRRDCSYPMVRTSAQEIPRSRTARDLGHPDTHRILKVFPCFVAFDVFCFTFHFVIMRLPRLLQEVIDNVRSDIQKISTSIDSAATQQAADNSKNQPPVRVVVSGDAETKADQKDAAQHRARSEEREEQRLTFEQAGIIVGFIVAVANIGIFLIAIASALISLSGAKAAQEGARAAREGAKAAFEQAKATKASIDATVSDFQLEQRAWVGVGNFVLTKIKSPDPVEATADLTNTGRSLARDVTIVQGILHASDVAIDIDAYAKNPVPIETQRINVGGLGLERGRFVLSPGQVMKLPGRTGTSDALGIENLKNGKKFLYFFGEVDYKDIFDRKHKTLFCAIYVSDVAAFSPCLSHNKAD